MPQRIFNVAKKLTSANNNQFIDLYTPNIIDSQQTDAIIYDFFVHFDVRSVDDLPSTATLPPGGSGLMSLEEIETDFQQRTSESPGKILALYYEVNGLTIPATKITFYRKSPGYQESLLQFLSTQSRLGIAYGTKIKAKVEELNSGLLGSGDEIAFWIVGEEIKELDADFYAQKYLLNSGG